MKAISVRQPWAWGIIYSTKDIENRGWPINYRGDILIHAAKKCTKKEYESTSIFCQSMGVSIPELKSLRRGQVIGVVTIVDCQFSRGNGLENRAGLLKSRLSVLSIKLTHEACPIFSSPNASQVASGWGVPGQYHWQLENPREITPIPYIGQLGIFEVPDDLVMEAIA